jgi:hypothetical protein
MWRPRHQDDGRRARDIRIRFRPWVVTLARREPNLIDDRLRVRLRKVVSMAISTYLSVPLALNVHFNFSPSGLDVDCAVLRRRSRWAASLPLSFIACRWRTLFLIVFSVPSTCAFALSTSALIAFNSFPLQHRSILPPTSTYTFPSDACPPRRYSDPKRAAKA